MESMKQLYTTTNQAQADLLVTVLRQHGIDCMLENENVRNTVGLPTPAVPLVITVRAVDHGRATGILNDAIQGRLGSLDIPADRFAKIRCACGKDLDIPIELEDSGFECPWCGRSTGPTTPDRSEPKP